MRQTLFYLLVVLLAFGSLIACTDKNEGKNTCDVNLQANETEIYSILAGFWLENSTSLKGKTIFIDKQTPSLKDKRHNISLENRSKTLVFEEDLVENFQQKNQQSILLDNNLAISNDYQYLSPETKFYKNNFTKDFTDAFPNAALLIGFSRIGFNENYTKALVYSYNTFDRGGYFELVRENCKWKIKKENNIWFH